MSQTRQKRKGPGADTGNAGHYAPVNNPKSVAQSVGEVNYGQLDGDPLSSTDESGWAVYAHRLGGEWGDVVLAPDPVEEGYGITPLTENTPAVVRDKIDFSVGFLSETFEDMFSDDTWKLICQKMEDDIEEAEQDKKMGYRDEGATAEYQRYCLQEHLDQVIDDKISICSELPGKAGARPTFVYEEGLSALMQSAKIGGSCLHNDVFFSPYRDDFDNTLWDDDYYGPAFLGSDDMVDYLQESIRRSDYVPTRIAITVPYVDEGRDTGEVVPLFYRQNVEVSVPTLDEAIQRWNEHCTMRPVPVSAQR